jgi:hypothetical protein
MRFNELVPRRIPGLKVRFPQLLALDCTPSTNQPFAFGFTASLIGEERCCSS